MRFFTAFIAIVFLAACEGPVGPTGPAGPTGDGGADGQRGATGLQGQPGVAATSLFVARFDNENEVFTWQKTRNTWEIIDGRLHISGSGSEDQGTHLATSTSFDGDIEVSVDTEWLEGERGFSYGLSLRIGTEGRYQFGIAAAGAYVVGFLGGADFPEALVDWTVSESINVNGKNNLRVTAYGDHFRFYVNDDLLTEVHDDRVAAGRISVYVEKLQEVAFDNLAVRAIQTEPLR